LLKLFDFVKLVIPSRRNLPKKIRKCNSLKIQSIFLQLSFLSETLNELFLSSGIQDIWGVTIWCILVCRKIASHWTNDWDEIFFWVTKVGNYPKRQVNGSKKVHKLLTGSALFCFSKLKQNSLFIGGPS